MLNKRELKRKTISLLTELMKSLLPEEQQSAVTKEGVLQQLGKRSYYKEQNTGVVRLGLCYKGVRQEVKRNPSVTHVDIKQKYNLG